MDTEQLGSILHLVHIGLNFESTSLFSHHGVEYTGQIGCSLRGVVNKGPKDRVLYLFRHKFESPLHHGDLVLNSSPEL